MNKLPPELRQGKNAPKGGKLPAKLIETFDCAEWLTDPRSWDRKKFTSETNSYMKALGYGSKYDRHLVSMLALQIEVAVRCLIAIDELPDITVAHNNGKNIGANPIYATLDKACARIQSLMNSLGISPQGRIVTEDAEKEEDPMDALLRGPGA